MDFKLASYSEQIIHTQKKVTVICGNVSRNWNQRGRSQKTFLSCNKKEYMCLSVECSQKKQKNKDHFPASDSFNYRLEKYSHQNWNISVHTKKKIVEITISKVVLFVLFQMYDFKEKKMKSRRSKSVI